MAVKFIGINSDTTAVYIYDYYVQCICKVIKINL